MNRRHPFENRYCNHCHRTTRHEAKEITYTCLACGIVKYPTQRVKPLPSTQPLARPA